jgi:hypothetical protein
LKNAKIPRRVDSGIGSGIDFHADREPDHIKDYTYRVTVGDICFVAIPSTRPTHCSK